MGQGRAQRLTGAYVPEPDRPLHGTSDEERAVGIQRDRLRTDRVLHASADLPPRAEVEDATHARLQLSEGDTGTVTADRSPIDSRGGWDRRIALAHGMEVEHAKAGGPLPQNKALAIRREREVNTPFMYRPRL